MPSSITFDTKLRTLDVRGHGTLTRADFDRLITEGIPLLAAHGGRRILSDYREARVAISIGEIYEIVGAIAEAIAAHGIPRAAVRRALVFANDEDRFSFVETAAQNRNQSLRVFRDLDEARRWLAEPDDE